MGAQEVCELLPQGCVTAASASSREAAASQFRTPALPRRGAPCLAFLPPSGLGGRCRTVTRSVSLGDEERRALAPSPTFLSLSGTGTQGFGLLMAGTLCQPRLGQNLARLSATLSRDGVKPRDRLAEVTQGGGTEKAGDRALSALGPGRRDSPKAGRELAGKLNRTPRLPSAAPLCLGLRSLPRSQNLAVTEAMSPTPPPTRLQTK